MEKSAGAVTAATASKKGNQRTVSKIWRALIYASAIFTFGVLLLVIGHVLVRGVPHLKPSLFEVKYNSTNVSMLPAIINTVTMILVTLLICVPIGVSTSIYLVEYAKTDNLFVRAVRLTTQTLQGIPSILFGLFGMLFFVTFLGWRYSMRAGIMTMTIMTLPLIITSTEEALKSVPDALREASYGLGARKLRTVFRIILPSAMPGILAGIILAIGRIVGESAALLYTSGAHTIIAGINQSGRTLAIHMYMLSTESLHKNEAYATAVVLLVVVLLVNALSARLASAVTQESDNE